MAQESTSGTGTVTVGTIKIADGEKEGADYLSLPTKPTISTFEHASVSGKGEQKLEVAEDDDDDDDDNDDDDDEYDEENAIEIIESTPSTQQDGGVRAWLQILGAFLVFSNLWGFIFAFGSFQSYYEITYFPTESSSNISWISTVATFLLIFIGVISGPLFDRGYFKTMLFVGAGGETLAVFIMAWCTKYWQMFLVQGVMIGLSNGMLYLPGLALVGRSFKKNRAVAMGVTTCGAPVGGVIYTLVFEQLISKLSWSWMVRVMGFIMLGTYALAFPLILWRVDNLGDVNAGKPATSAPGAGPGSTPAPAPAPAPAPVERKIFDASALRDLPFWSYSTSNFLIFCGYMTPFIFMASYGQLELGMSRDMSLYVMMIAQATSVVGRLVASYTASKLGVMIPWFVSVLASGVLCIGWIGAKSTGAFITFAALYGAFSGPVIPLPPSIFPVVCPDRRVLGARLGMAQAIGSIASLIGPPIAAALTTVSSNNSSSHSSRTNGKTNFLGCQLFAGVTMICGSINLLGLWTLLVKKRQAKVFV